MHELQGGNLLGKKKNAKYHHSHFSRKDRIRGGAHKHRRLTHIHTHRHLHVSIRCHIGFCGFFKILGEMPPQLHVNTDSFGPGLILALHISSLSCRLHLHLFRAPACVCVCACSCMRMHCQIGNTWPKTPVLCIRRTWVLQQPCLVAEIWLIHHEILLWLQLCD